MHFSTGTGLEEIAINTFARQLFCGIAKHQIHRSVGKFVDRVEFGRICHQQSTENDKYCRKSNQVR